MTLTIELTPELEARLREEAARSGLDARALALRALQERFDRTVDSAVESPHLPREESMLLQKINQGPPEAIWSEYHDLVARRQSGSLTEEDHTRLLGLSEQIEAAHVERIGYVAELARRRQIPLRALMKQLGIGPRRVPNASPRRD